MPQLDIDPCLAQASVPTPCRHQQKLCDVVLQDGASVAAPLQIDGTMWPMTCVSMGNPHAVTFGPADSPIRVDSLPLAQLGPHFETHPVFPAKTNTEFVEVMCPDHTALWVNL